MYCTYLQLGEFLHFCKEFGPDQPDPTEVVQASSLCLLCCTEQRLQQPQCNEKEKKKKTSLIDPIFQSAWQQVTEANTEWVVGSNGKQLLLRRDSKHMTRRIIFSGT